MGHFPTPFPSLGNISSWTPPQLIPIGQRRHESEWTGRSVVYNRSFRWEGSVSLRRFAPTWERLAAKERSETASIFTPAWINALEAGTHSFPLQLSLQTLQFRTYTFSVAPALDTATGLLKASLATGPDSDQWGIAAGAFVRIGVRYYQIVLVNEISSNYEVYFTPSILPPTGQEMSSLYPTAVSEVPQIKAVTVSSTFGLVQKNGIEEGHSFQWREALV